MSRDDADSVLTGLTSAGFVHPGTPRARRISCSCSPAGAQDGVDAADTAAVYARLAAQLDLAGAGAVLAGARAARPDATGAVGVARADPQVVARLSTVDDVQSGTGRVAAVLALHEQLDGRAGSYGTGTGASTVPPPRSGSLREPESRVRRRDRGAGLYAENPCSNAPRVICSSPEASPPPSARA